MASGPGELTGEAVGYLDTSITNDLATEPPAFLALSVTR
jgi:hypothetical protein